MKKLLSILLLFVSFGAIAQTYDQLPAGSKPYGNQPYLFNGNILMGTSALKYRLIPTKARVDSLLALKAPVSPSGAYIQANASPSQNAAINVLGNVYSETGFQTAGYGFQNNGSAVFADTRTRDLSINYGSNQGTLVAYNLTANREYQLPDASGKLALESQIPVPEDYISSLNGSGTNTTLQSPTIVNGSINSAPIGLNFPNQGKFTTLNASNSTTLELSSNKGQNNGYASLDASGKVPLSQVNDVLLGAVNYQGNYNAANNTPALPSATGNKGKYYVVTNSGTQQGLEFNSGDWIISNGTIWEKVDNNNKVASVNGRIGAVSGLAEQSSLAPGQTIGANTTGNAATANIWNRILTSDFNNPTGFGLLEASNGAATNQPENDSWGQGIQFSTNNNPAFANQLVASINGSFYQRVKAGGTWYNWKKIATSEDLSLQNITNGGAITNNITYFTGENSFTNPTSGFALNIRNIGIDSYDHTNAVGARLILNASGGNVGINTYNPSEKLDVNGNIKVDGNTTVRNDISSLAGDLKLIRGDQEYAYIMRSNDVGKRKLKFATEADINPLDEVYFRSLNTIFENKIDVNGSIKSTALAGEGNSLVAVGPTGTLVRAPSDIFVKPSDIAVGQTIGANTNGSAKLWSGESFGTSTARNSGDFMIYNGSNWINKSVTATAPVMFNSSSSSIYINPTYLANLPKLSDPNVFTGGVNTFNGGLLTPLLGFKNGGTSALNTIQSNAHTANVNTYLPANGGQLITDEWAKSGTYTPTITPIIGAPTSMSATTAHYSKIGNEVTVTGFVTAQVNTSNSNTGISISLPMPSNFTTQEDAAGIGSTTNTNYPVAVSVTAEPTNDYAVLLIGAFPVQAAGTKFGYSFTYTIKQ